MSLAVIVMSFRGASLTTGHTLTWFDVSDTRHDSGDGDIFVVYYGGPHHVFNTISLQNG